MIDRITNAQITSESPAFAKPMLGDVFSPRIEVANNLEFMQSISSNTLDLIYCDVLYGTGRDFMDYKDLYPMKEIIYEHYEPRIKEMHRILKDTGSIYLQMDYRIVHWVRCIMDDVFGYGNFRNEIVWCYTMPNNYKKSFNKKHDNILFYSKSNDWTFNWKDVTVDYSDSSKNRAKYAHSKTSQMGKNGKMLLDEGKLVEDYWLIPVVSGNERVKYQTQKPKKIIERIVKASSNQNDLVGDFYLGSGTTAVVCKELSRRFVGCDINPNAVKLTNERLNGTLF